MTAPRRPEFHFTPESGWINDPLGLTFVEGQYHLFFQYVPDSTTWQPNCHWGHAVSPDLVSWREQPVALAPGEGDDGIWSGSLVLNGTQAHLFYTSIDAASSAVGRIRAATPRDSSWRDWVKDEVVVTAPEDLHPVTFRDPFVCWDATTWRMLVGTGLPDGTAAAASFSSPDLAHWTYDGLAAQRSVHDREPVWTGSLWECPQIFEIDGCHVLVTSVWENDVLHYVTYAVGDYVDGTFTARHWGRLTHGNSYYAPSFFRDRNGEPGLIFWMRGYLDADAGRAGALSVPHLLRLVGDRLVTVPHPDLRRYASPVEAEEREHLAPGWAYVLDWAPDAAGHLRITQGVFTLRIDLEPDGTCLIHRNGDPVVILAGAASGVTVLLDGPSVEVFTPGGAYGVGMTEASPDDPISIEGAGVTVQRLDRRRDTAV